MKGAVMFVLRCFPTARYFLSLHLGMITLGVIFQYLYLDHSRVYAVWQMVPETTSRAIHEV